MNNITVVGVISMDLRTANDGRVVNVSISERINNDRQYIDCVAFNQTAEKIVQLCKKGTLIVVNGTLSLKPYTNKQGMEVKQTKVIINAFEVLKDGSLYEKETSKSSHQSYPKSYIPPADAKVEQPKIDDSYADLISSDDLPF